MSCHNIREFEEASLISSINTTQKEVAEDYRGEPFLADDGIVKKNVRE